MKIMLFSVITVCVAFAGQSPMSGSEGNMPMSERNMDEIREILDGVKSSVQEAYEELLVTAPEASGELNARFVITPAGAVTDLEVTCTEGLETLVDPVTETFAALDFGSCPGQTENLPVSVPLTLVPPQRESE